MRKSEAIRTIESFGNLIGFHYIQAQRIAAEIARQRNRIVTLSPKSNRKRQRHLRKRLLSKYRNCIVIEPITLKLNLELYETLVECVKESRKVVNIPDLIDYILDNEDTELANEVRIIERRWDYALQGIDNILCFDNVPEKMKILLFDYKSEMRLFGNDLHLIDRVCTISDEEATRLMFSQDWKEIREAETKQTSSEYFSFVLDKVNRLLGEKQPSEITVSNGIDTGNNLSYSAELLGFFNGEKSLVQKFLDNIKGATPEMVIRKVNYCYKQGLLKVEKNAKGKESVKSLWKCLNGLGYYSRTYKTFCDSFAQPTKTSELI